MSYTTTTKPHSIEVPVALKGIRNTKRFEAHGKLSRKYESNSTNQTVHKTSYYQSQRSNHDAWKIQCNEIIMFVYCIWYEYVKINKFCMQWFISN